MTSAVAAVWTWSRVVEEDVVSLSVPGANWEGVWSAEMTAEIFADWTGPDGPDGSEWQAAPAEAESVSETAWRRIGARTSLKETESVFGRHASGLSRIELTQSESGGAASCSAFHRASRVSRMASIVSSRETERA